MKTAEEIIDIKTPIFYNTSPTSVGAAISINDACDACLEYADQFKPKWISVSDGLPEIDESDTWKKQQGHSKTVPVIEQGNLFFGWYNYQMNACQVVGRVGNIQVSKWFNLPDHE